MTRALIVGPRDELEGTIERLYDLKLLHIVDHREGEEGLEIGKPLLKASKASEILVKLRSLASVLQIEETEPAAEAAIAGEIRPKILSLELNISEEDATRKRIQALLAELDRKIEETTPFAQLPLSLEDYRGYENLQALVGKVPQEIQGLDGVTSEYEAFEAPGFLAVFVVKSKADDMRSFLAQHGFTSVAVPEGEGHPRDLLATLLKDRERWQARSIETEERLTTLRERYASFLVAAKAHLETEVEKAEAPLRFAVTDHTFLVEGWVPTASFSTLKGELEGVGGMFVSDLEADAHASDPPVLIKNVRPFRPFELLVKLFGMPNYHEIDPTFSLAIVFPIFFGLMIGDAGYGAAWVLFGVYLLRRRIKKSGPFRDLILTVTWGGVFALLFGTFVFAEAFGIPFHLAPEVAAGARGAAALNWSGILGFSIPIHAQIEKLQQVPDFLVLSIAAAFLHLGLAFTIGLVNDLGPSKKHAAGKVAWLLILTGLFVVLIVRASGTRFGGAIWNGAFAWFPRGGLVRADLGFGAANPIPWAAISLLVVGIGLLLATEGGLHIMEVFGLVANMISYTRLAAVGVAKAAMALAFNIIALDSLFFPGLSSGNVLLVVGGLAVAVLLHALIIFPLGALSAYVQSLRLNYVEYFLKFYKGTGRAFGPFGIRTTTEV